MTESEALAEQLTCSVEGGPWYGSSLRELLANVSAETAVGRPLPGAHSIREITSHLAAWFAAVRRRLGGAAVELSPAEDWPPGSGDASGDWDEARAAVDREYPLLLQAVRALGENDLDLIVPGRSYSMRFMLHGVVQHVAYHSAQIALLKKAGGAVESDRILLRHTVATVSYRAGKALRGAPGRFGTFRVGPTSRTPVEILAHIGDLFDWALSIARGKEQWRSATPLPWEKEVDRFFTTIASFDSVLASDAPLGATAESLFQGPIADALTHVGQLTLLRRVAEAPVRGESYYRAEIVAGRVGPEQAAPRREFD